MDNSTAVPGSGEMVEKAADVQLISPTDGLFSILKEVATNPDADAEKMEKIYALVEKAQDRESEQAYASSMVSAQTEMPKVVARRVNDQTKSKYAKHEDIFEQCAPIWADHGFALSFDVESTQDGQMVIACDVLHRGGHVKRYTMPLALDDKGLKGSANKTQVHASGSTFTYGQRYLTCKIFNIPTGDDRDGNTPVADALRISDEQALQIDAFIDENKINREKFMDWIKKSGGYEEIDEILAKDFDTVMKTLRSSVS